MNGVRQWLDRQARTKTQRIDLTVALFCSYAVMWAAQASGWHTVGAVFFWLTAALTLIIFAFILRDHWENRP